MTITQGWLDVSLSLGFGGKNGQTYPFVQINCLGEEVWGVGSEENKVNFSRYMVHIRTTRTTNHGIQNNKALYSTIQYYKEQQSTE